MSAILDAIDDHLVVQGVAGGVTAWPIYKERLAVQGRAVLLQGTGGFVPEQGSDRAWGQPTVQVVVQGRAGDNQAAQLQAEAVIDALDRADVITGLIDVFAQQSAPAYIGETPVSEPRYSVNFRLVEE